MKPELRIHAGISSEAVRDAVGAAATLDDLVALLDGDDDLVQAIGWREWYSLDRVLPTFTDDVIEMGDDDWEVLAADARRVLVLYLHEANHRWQLLLVER